MPLYMSDPSVRRRRVALLVPPSAPHEEPASPPDPPEVPAAPGASSPLTGATRSGGRWLVMHRRKR